MSRTARSGPRENKKRAPVGINAALGNLVQELGINKTLGEYTVITSWEKMVGERIAKVTRAQRIENGVLFVSVANAPWRAELTLRRQEILEKINSASGRQVVKEIRFR